jgi:hypothetical protein
MATGTHGRQSRFNAGLSVSNKVGTGRRRVAGPSAWGIYIQDTVSSNDYGLFDLAFVERTEVASIWASFAS